MIEYLYGERSNTPKLPAITRKRLFHTSNRLSRLCLRSAGSGTVRPSDYPQTTRKRRALPAR